MASLETYHKKEQSVQNENREVIIKAPFPHRAFSVLSNYAGHITA